MSKYSYIQNNIETYVIILSIIILSTANTDLPEENSIIAADDPNISNLNVAHYDCSIQNNLRQFSITQVKPCTQVPSGLESTRAIVKVYVNVLKHGNVYPKLNEKNLYVLKPMSNGETRQNSLPPKYIGNIQNSRCQRM